MKQFFDNNQLEKLKQNLGLNDKKSNIEKDLIYKTYKYIKYIKWLPWLLMIWVWNSIAMNNAKKSSDIDLFIVTSNNTMWLNRIIITFIFSLLWVRKTKNKHAWRFCLSFFVSSSWLDFDNWKQENDIYLYYWVLTMIPLLDNNNTYNKFIEKNSSWADFWKYKDIIKDNKKYIKYSWNKSTNNNITKNIDRLIKKIFIKKTYNTYNKIWKPYWVIINDNMLKFHNNDIRIQIKKELNY